MTTDNNNIQNALHSFAQYVELADGVRAQYQDKRDYYILIREQNELRFIAWINEASRMKAFSSTHVQFQHHVRLAATDPSTVIKTVGEQVGMMYDFNGRAYTPSHLDVFETSKIIRDVTGLNF